MVMEKNTDRESPTVWFTILLCALLGGPFLSAIFFIEPFPAVILPGGAQTRDINNSFVKNTQSKLFAYSKGSEEEVDMTKLLHSVPDHHIRYVIKDEFGFKKSNVNENYAGLIKKIFPWKNRTYQKMVDLKSFYSKNLGFTIDSLKVLNIESVFDVSSGALVDRKKVNETTIDLSIYE